MSEEAVAAPAAPAAPAATPSAPAAPAESDPKGAQNTGTQATPAEAVGDQPKEVVTPEQAAKREGRRFERKLSAALRREAEAKARYEVLEKEIAKYRQSAPAADPAEPKLEDFKSIEEFGAAVKKHASEKALREHTDKQRADSQKRELDALAESWAEKAEVGAEKYEDWNEVVGDVKPNAPWAIAAMEAENAADVMYHLGKDDAKEAKRIAALPPRAQIREIGKIEAKLLAEPAKPKTPSKAPAPITPLTGTAPADAAAPSDQDDMATWMKKRQKQVHGGRR